jgi:isopentenyl diphosphate isomerase/L-lactate dehydrogenase-like FMN-dependent dehydrogenase
MTRDFKVLHQFIPAARTNLSDGTWDYLIGAAETETTHKRNRLALDSLGLRPRILRDVTNRDITGSVLGCPLKMPVILAPIGSLQDLVEGGAASVAIAAAQAGVMQMVSSSASNSLEEVATASSAAKIYQLYIRGDRDWVDDHVARAIDAGYAGICLTVDLDLYGRRERDMAKGFTTTTQKTAIDQSFQERFSWSDVARLREKFDIPMMIKGIATGEDARLAVECGMEAVYASNHGGRQLDHGLGTLDFLPEVVDAVGGRVEVIVDGGIMRGSDIVKALCLGATAVGIGRMYVLAAAAAGVPGVIRAMEILHHELDTTLGLLGVRNLEDLDESYLAQTRTVNQKNTYSAFPLLDEGY